MTARLPVAVGADPHLDGAHLHPARSVRPRSRWGRWWPPSQSRSAERQLGASPVLSMRPHRGGDNPLAPGFAKGGSVRVAIFEARDVSLRGSHAKHLRTDFRPVSRCAGGDAGLGRGLLRQPICQIPPSRPASPRAAARVRGAGRGAIAATHPIPAGCPAADGSDGECRLPFSSTT